MIRATVKPLDSETRPYTIQVPDSIPLVLIRQDTRMDPAVRVLRLMYPAMGSNVPPIYTECGPAGFYFMPPDGLSDDVLSPETQARIDAGNALCVCGLAYREHPALMPDDGPWPAGCDGFNMALIKPQVTKAGPHRCDDPNKTATCPDCEGPSSQGRYGDEDRPAIGYGVSDL